MHKKNIFSAGRPFGEADKVLVMLHGRGAHAGDILRLGEHLNVSDFTLLAPQASNNTWYPYSFLAGAGQNEPWLSSALELLDEIVNDIKGQGIPAAGIYFLGFSQGACLCLEFVARHAAGYGGVIAFTGGLIGDNVIKENYSGDFEHAPVLLTTGNPDPHVPVERVRESAGILEEMNAKVNLRIYENRPHTISQEEIEAANTIIFK